MRSRTLRLGADFGEDAESAGSLDCAKAGEKTSIKLAAAM